MSTNNDSTQHVQIAVADPTPFGTIWVWRRNKWWLLHKNLGNSLKE